MRTQLFIENYEIELNESVQFLLNKQFEELSNPTIIINDWSKTISIPFSESNNKIFGYIYKPEMVIIGDQSNPDAYKQMGMYFDPTKKLDFRLIYNNTELMQGYAKMNDIKMDGNKGVYNITLFGLLGKIFQELNKITFDETTEDTDYLIHGEDYVYTSISQGTVYDSWTSAGQQTSDLIKRGQQHYRLTDIIGFAPNNAYVDGFDYKAVQTTPSQTKQFDDILEEHNFKAATGIDAKTVIPNGLFPREIGEYRSYMQQPFIYFNKLFRIFMEKAQQLTGYSFYLDPNFFTTNNPYWYRLVYMLRKFEPSNGDILTNKYSKFSASLPLETSPSIASWASSADFTTEKTARMCVHLVDYEQFPGVLVHTSSANRLLFTNDNHILNVHVYLNTILDTITQDLHFKNNTGLVITVKASGSTAYTQEQTFLLRNNGSSSTLSGATVIDIPGNGDSYFFIFPTLDMYFNCKESDFGDYVEFTIKTHWLDSAYPLERAGAVALGDVTLQFGGAIWSGSPVGDLSFMEVNVPNPNTLWFRSGAIFKLNDLWNKDYNVFDEILKFCKRFRIGIFVDDIERRIKFIQLNNYFANYTISDWTDKVDKSKEFIVNPITFDNKYVLFNYEDSNTKLGKIYRQKYEYDYGEYRLTTDYNFNSETTNLFDKIKTSITNTDNILSWTNLYDNTTVMYSFSNEIFIYNKDDKGNQVDLFGSYYFHNGLANFDTEEKLALRSVKLSDDTAMQQVTNKYFYTQGGGPLTSVSTYPLLDIVRSDKMCLFSAPKENYTYLNNYADKTTIYSKYWQKYINERYSIQNRLVTCYLVLTPRDWLEFKYCNFIKIDGILYMINKIYDYNIETPESTKVDLISITDVLAYYLDDDADYINVSPSSISLNGSSASADITVDAYLNAWDYELLDEHGDPVTNPTQITLTKTNNTTLHVEKNGDYSLNYTIRFYTYLHSATVAVTGARSQYIEFIPSSVVVTKNATTEFDVRIQTNLTDVNMLASSSVQWYNSTTLQWKTTAYQAASQVSGWASGDSTLYNAANEDRDFTIHIKTVNPSADGNISFFETTPVTQYYYVHYLVADSASIVTLNAEGTAIQTTDSVEYHGTSSIRSYKLYSTSAWSATVPQGVRSYGATSGNAGLSSITFDWGGSSPNSTNTITFTNTGGGSCSLVCSYVIE